ncbi:regulatory protein RecX [Alkalimonas collagenimarina]|uniref:Regulatory protein RecX n=1 Tax=Alkalimonas collagenimarina TaxID=400390 RepID=A0ABT9GWT3_9GAMM|nr:regulatory protein RecX [Alkalimonas collagenimarina]MDP4535520.1 regulatory protein RecX [Alkalimonas collagenimarina]
MMTLNELKKAALTLLARREYSCHQLRQRLLSKTEDDQLVQQVISWCQSEQYQSDERFVDMLIRSRLAKGYGPLYIHQECRQHGVLKELVEQQLAAESPDWCAIARQLYDKKYANNAINSASEKAKRMRYLLQRGFTSEHCHALFHTKRS